MMNDLIKTQNIIEYGIKRFGELPSNLFHLAKYYKSYKKYDIEQTKQALIDFMNIQIVKGIKGFDNNMEYINRQINSSVNSAYAKDYTFHDDIRIDVTLSEMNEIHKLKSKGDRMMAFILLYTSKLYADENGIFYAYHNDIAEYIHTHRNTVTNSSKRLINSKIIELVQKYKKKASGTKTISREGTDINKKYYVNEPNQYRYLLQPCGNVIYTIINPDNLLNEYYKMYDVLIKEYGFKVSDKVKKNLNKYIVCK
jgi:hypothetical protein